MPQLAPVILKDRQATPVSHTFTPINIDQRGVARLSQRLNGVPAGEKVLTLGNNKAQKSPFYRGLVKLEVPTLRTITSGPDVGKVVVEEGMIVEITTRVPESWTEAQVNDVIGMAADALAGSQALISAVIVKRENAY